MEFLALLHLNRKRRVSVFTPEDIARMKKQHKDLINLQNNIIAVNFKTTPTFIDPNEALMCLVVLTSDGAVGSLSHLQTNINVTQYVEALSQFYKYKQGIPVCLVGGKQI